MTEGWESVRLYTHPDSDFVVFRKLGDIAREQVLPFRANDAEKPLRCE